jgi:serine/threonine protein kinase
METRTVRGKLDYMQTIDFERHTPAMDMFSLGVMLFVMLTGHKPMKSEQARKLAYSKVQARDYSKMASWTWKRLSAPARELVLRLMERDPLKRLTAAQVLFRRS